MFILILLFSLIFNPNEDELKQEVQNYLQKNLSYEKFEFEIISKPKIEKEEIKIDEKRELRLAGNLAYVPVNLVLKNNSTQSYLTIRLKLYKQVLVTKENIKKGSELLQNQFEKKLFDVSSLRGKAISDFEKLNGLKSKFNLKKNEVLTENDVEQIPILKSGDKVLAILQKGSVVISFDAIAKQSGSIGDLIRIISSDKKQFKAKVIDNLSVSIIE